MRPALRLVVVLCGALALAGCWSQYRAGPEHTGLNVDETRISTTTVGGLHERWAATLLTDTQDQLFREPTIVGDTAYVDSFRGQVFAVNMATGSARWSTSIPGTFGAPTVAGGSVFIGADNGVLYALDTRTGAVRWTTAVGGTVEAPPTIAGNTLFAASVDPGRLAAIDARTGAVLWSTAIGDFGLSVAVAGDTVFAAFNTQATATTPLSGTVEAVRASTGEVIWSYTTAGFVDGAPAVSDGMVFDDARDPDNSLFALDASSGALRWRTPGVVGTNGVAGQSVAVAYGRVFMSSVAVGIASFDETNGGLLWSRPGEVTKEPSVANGVVLGDLGGSQLVAYDAMSGERLFTSAVLGNAGANPAVGEGQVLVPVHTVLYDFET